MESRTHLHYVLFQLTPTRTRCDLVICAGNTNEKLASGLLEPFVSHLKSAKDQVSKGGYSITLSSDASWFTKATLERFVRFVSTPEVLERFVTLEMEIQQIEKSIQSNEVQDNDVATDPEGNTAFAEGNFKRTSSSTKAKGEQNGSGDGNSVPEENFKVRLQRILETRSAVLHKEQAMAYARALVAGFDLEYLDDLISFANAFGALRLREACINFMELCKEKNEDRLWMDEIAAMQAFSRPDLPYLATSGITLASDANEVNQIDMSVTESSTSHGSLDASQESRVPTTTVATDGKTQVPYPWQNNFQQYMNTFQGPMFPPQMAPFPPGFAFPGMQVPPPCYPKWPPVEDPGHAFGGESDTRSYKSSSRNKKKHRKASEKVEADVASESSTGSDSESDGEVENGKRHGKKHGKKSSRKVVIRNINYITSERDGERKGGSSEGSLSDEDEAVSGYSLKRQVERAVGSFHRRKSSASNHLKKQESKKHHIKDEQEGAEEEKKNNGWGAFESLLMREEEPLSSLSVELYREDCISSKSSEVSVTKQRAVSDDSFVMTEKDISSIHSARFEESENGGNIRRIQKTGEGTFDDSLFLQKSEKSGIDISSTPYISAISSSTIRVQRDGDWFITNPLNKHVSPRGNLDLKGVEADSAFLGGSLGTESKMRDLVIDDSFLVEGRGTNEDHLMGSRSMADISMVSDIIQPTKSQKEISHANGFEPDDLYMMLERDNDVDHAASAWTQEMIYESNTSLTEVNRRQSESETVDDSKLPSKDAKVKVSGKEVRSKTGSVGRSKTDLTSRTKNSSPGNRVPIQRGKTQKEEENRWRMEELRIQRQKRIAERSSNNGVASGGRKRITVETRVAKIPSNPKKATNQSLATTEEPKLQKPPVLRNSTIERLAASRVTKKIPPTNSKSAPKKMEASKKKNGIQSSEAEKQSRKNGGQEKETAEVPVISSEEPTNQHALLNDDFKDITVLESIAVEGNGRENVVSSKVALNDEIFKEQDKQPPSPPVVHKPTKSVQFKAETEISFISSPVSETDNVRELTLHPEPSPPNLVSQTSGLELDMSTTPPEEQMHSRKKWNGDEKSPKTAKGLRKLLLFGKKSLNSLRN